MEPNAPQTTKPSNSGAGIVFASMAGLYVLICVCLGAFVFIARQEIPGIRDYFPTQTSTPTATRLPTSTPIAHTPASDDQRLNDDFSENTHAWRTTRDTALAQVKNGQLLVESLQGGRLAMTHCDKCAYNHANFYIEADFSTSQEIDEPYGFSFNIQSEADNYYTFEINTVKGRYALYEKKEAADGDNIWMLRVSKESELIKPYPQINKLGVYFDKDRIELYINKQLVDHYQDPGTPLTFGEFGFYADNAGFQLIVDNLFSYGK